LPQPHRSVQARRVNWCGATSHLEADPGRDTLSSMKDDRRAVVAAGDDAIMEAYLFALGPACSISVVAPMPA
jgi:hypothetical protein